MLLKISEISQKNICVGVSFQESLSKRQKRLQHRCFPVKFTLITYQNSVSQFFSKAKSALLDDTFLLAIEEIVGVFHICIVSLCRNNIKIKLALHLVLEDNVSYTIVKLKKFSWKSNKRKNKRTLQNSNHVDYLLLRVIACDSCRNDA